MSTPKTAQRWDVFIIECETGKIETVAGSDLLESGSFHTRDKRMETVIPRLNEYFFCDYAPAGMFKKGDVFKHGNWS